MEALMHASLAYVSPEVTYLNDIVQRHSCLTIRVQDATRLTTLLSIPVELLLIIRSHLIPAVITDLRVQSRSALSAYQNSLRDLLCSDCLSYNEDIYGPDVWQWESSGPCACPLFKSASSRDLFERDTTLRSSKWSHNPLQFVDSLHWLENHLSEKFALSAQHITSSSSIPAIWQLTSYVLRDLDCEVRPDGTHRVLANNTITTSPDIAWGERRGSTLWRYLRSNSVHIAPRISWEDDFAGVNGDIIEGLWRADAILRRAQKELALDRRSEYEDSSDVKVAKELNPARRSESRRGSVCCGFCAPLCSTPSNLLPLPRVIAAVILIMTIHACHVSFFKATAS